MSEGVTTGTPNKVICHHPTLSNVVMGGPQRAIDTGKQAPGGAEETADRALLDNMTGCGSSYQLLA